MANRRSFKSDISFLEKISIGAVGTRRVFEDLRSQGHNPLELEHGSMSFKIWKRIKIKRIRVPDILCVRCARRIESRAKTTLEISMSHSFSDLERGWDYGLDDRDVIALVVCERSGERPVDWHADNLVQYVSVQDLRTAHDGDRVAVVRPKGAEEGFEARLIWPAAVATSSGTVVSVGKERIQYRRKSDNRTITLRMAKRGVRMTPLGNEGDEVVQNQVLATVAPVTRLFPCSDPVTHERYLQWLSSPSLSERYTAAKGLFSFKRTDVSEALAAKVRETAEHIYVRLEAAASLARQDETEGWTFIKQCLKDTYLQNRLEAIITLADIQEEESSQVLCDVLLDEQQNPEIRAGAAWALGKTSNKLVLGALVDSFTAVEEGIRIEAARALAKLASQFAPDILARFPSADSKERPGIAWALSKSGRFRVDDLLNTLVDENARVWVAYMIGTQNQEKCIGEMEELKRKDPEVYFAVTVLWNVMASWVYNLQEYG